MYIFTKWQMQLNILLSSLNLVNHQFSFTTHTVKLEWSISWIKNSLKKKLSNAELRKLCMNIVWKLKKNTEIDDTMKHRQEKSTYCFTSLYKIQISNLLYIIAHEGVCSKL